MRHCHPISMGEMVTKHKRTTPNRHAPTQTTEQDVDMLDLVHWSRSALTRRQIERVTCRPKRPVQRRLRCSQDAGFLKAHLQGEALHRDNVYSLTPAGAAFLSTRRNIEARPTRMPRPQRLQHSLAIRDLGIAALLAGRQGSLPLAEVRFEEDLASEPAFSG